jgi:hypothetical protein
MVFVYWTGAKPYKNSLEHHGNQWSSMPIMMNDLKLNATKRTAAMHMPHIIAKIAKFYGYSPDNIESKPAKPDLVYQQKTTWVAKDPTTNRPPMEINEEHPDTFVVSSQNYRLEPGQAPFKNLGGEYEVQTKYEDDRYDKFTNSRRIWTA